MASDVVLDLWLIRHAESLGNVDGTAADSPLTARGSEQAAALRRALSDQAFDAAFVSPLIRARQTFDAALGPLAPVVDARLAEFVSPPGARVLDTSRISFAELRALAAQKPSDPGESGSAFKARVAAWCDALPSSGSIVVVTHFGVVREIIARYVGFQEAPQAIAHAGIFRIAICEGEVRVIAWNETTHLFSSAKQS